jgi:sialidase-1
MKMNRTYFRLLALTQVAFAYVALTSIALPMKRAAADSPDSASMIGCADVFTSGSGGYNTYRIPAIVVSKSGTLLAFCEGRKESKSDTGNIDLLLKRSTDNGKTWSDSIVIWDDDANTCGNPTPVVDQSTGTIWLPMTWNLGSDHESEIKAGTSEHPRRIFVTHSSDDGLTWAEPTEISKSVRQDHWRWYATGPGNAIQLARGQHAGRLLIPANHSDHTDATQHPYRSHVFWSDDHGATWQLGGVHGEKTNESAVVQRSDGSVLQAMRSYHGTNQRAMAISEDGGKSWGKMYLDKTLDTPVCQASMIRYSYADEESPGQPSRILFASPKGKKRRNMHVWISYDEGQTWPLAKQIDADTSAYSNLIALPENKVGLLYEKGGYKTITLKTFSMPWLESNN